MVEAFNATEGSMGGEHDEIPAEKLEQLRKMAGYVARGENSRLTPMPVASGNADFVNHLLFPELIHERAQQLDASGSTIGYPDETPLS